MTLTAKDRFLAYQAAIGTDEVVLPHPYIPASRKRPEPVHTESRKSSVVQMPTEVSGDFFQDVIKSLTEPAIQPRKVETPKPAVVPVSAPVDFPNLDAYWKFIATEVPNWFPAAGTNIARAEGAVHPLLALVEYAPEAGTPARVFGGEPGVLLERMMKAIGLDRSRLYLTSILKSPAPSARGWARKDAARMLPYLFRELRLAGAEYVLLLGEPAAQAVLKSGTALQGLRQKISEAEGMAFAASFHPADLQKDESLKREAWSDLKWLQPRLPAGVKT